MDMEQEEMQFLGLFGMVKESFKIIVKWRKIFSQITLALILPLAAVFLANIQVSSFLYSRIHHDEGLLDRAPANTSAHHRLSDLVTTEKIEYWLLMVAYFVFLLVLALLSTSAVVYTIARVYTGSAVTLKKVVTVVPRVWKRLMVTFTWSFLLAFIYDTVAFSVIFLMITNFETSWILISCLTVFIALYWAGLVYVSVIWHLASVISVLEDDYGIQAMMKSRMLIKGKMAPAVEIFHILTLSYFWIQDLFKTYVVYSPGLPLATRLGIGAACLLFLLVLFLFGLVIQTVIYFVCKSYHHQSIDKSSLADHLEVYLLAEFKEVQLERI